MVTVQVKFSEPVLVTGTPQIFVQYANTNVRSYYESGAGSDTLYFTYTVQDHGVNGAISIPENALTLTGSSHTITDIAGNAAILTHAAVSASSSYQVQIDGTGPDAPSIYTIEGDNKINITEKADGVFVAGTAEANSTVSIAWGADTREVTADAGGNWYAYYGAGDSTIASGTITVTPTDGAGNVGTAGSIAVIVDTSAPVAPTIALNDDTGSSDSDTLTSNGQIDVTLAETNGSWQYLVNNGGWADGSGTSLTLTGDGAKTVKVREIDEAGNIGAAETLSVTLDTEVEAGTLSVDNLANATGLVPTTSDIAFDLVLGDEESSSTVVYQLQKDSGGWSDEADASISMSSGDGLYEFRAKVTDVAGNVGYSNTVRLNLSTNADVTAPTISSVVADWGAVLNSSEASSGAGIVVTLASGDGGAEDGQIVTVTLDGQNYTGIVSSNSASVLIPASELTALTSGSSYNIDVNVSDAAGNAATEHSSTSFSVDTVAPNAPVIDSITGDNIVDASENSVGFTITGTGEYVGGQGATITAGFSDGATLSGTNTTTVQADGTWSITVDALEAGNKFNDGSELITVTQTDAAGNVSVAKTQLFSVSTTLYTSGDLSSTDLSSYSTVYLSGNAVLPNSNDKLPNALNIQSNGVTVSADLDLSGINLSNLGNLTVDTNATLTLSAGQANSFNAAGGTIDVSAGTISVTTGGNLSSMDLGSVSLTLNADSTLPDSNADLPVSIDAGNVSADGYSLTVANDLDLSSVTITQAGGLTVNSNVNLTLTAAQLTNFENSGLTVSNSGTVTVEMSDTNDITALTNVGAVSIDNAANVTLTATQAALAKVDDT